MSDIIETMGGGGMTVVVSIEFLSVSDVVLKASERENPLELDKDGAERGADNELPKLRNVYETEERRLSFNHLGRY